MYLYISVFLVILALVLLWLSSRQRRGLGLPAGRVLYADTGAERRVEQPLYADDLLLVGRPDYLVESAEGLVPVEVKSGSSPQKPYDTHIFQLAAYCVLVARNFKQRPAYGIIRYPQRSFRIEFTQELENQLLGLLKEMRNGLDLAELHRSHNVFGRCRACGFGQLCEEHL
jgi:CRISPR-associated exonuclease Cas4